MSEVRKTAEEMILDKGIKFPGSRSPRDFNLTAIVIREYAAAQEKEFRKERVATAVVIGEKDKEIERLREALQDIKRCGGNVYNDVRYYDARDVDEIVNEALSLKQQTDKP